MRALGWALHGLARPGCAALALAPAASAACSSSSWAAVGESQLQQQQQQQPEQQRRRRRAGPAAAWLPPAAAAFHSCSAARADDEAAPPPAPAPVAGRKKGGKAAAAAAGLPPAEAAAQLAELKANYRRSRMLEFYERILSRELILKLNLRSVNELPRLERVDLSIQAKDAAGGAYVEKWQLLLHALGLEILTGEPAAFCSPSNRYYAKRNAVTGVKVSLRGAAAHDALEKLAYLLLPSQSAFDGLLVRQLDRAGHLHFKVPSMVNLPDFEEMYETFENLGSLDVGLVLRGAARRRGRSQLLLTGLQLPVLARKHQVASADARGGGGGGGGGGEEGGA